MSVTQFAASVLGLLEPVGSGALCWLCGGACGPEARQREDVIAPTFTQHNLAAVADSQVVCGACEAFTLAASWQGVVARRGMQLKTWTQAGWHSYSHFIAEPDVYECPRPGRVREILLDPPCRPWLLGINDTGKKHTIFRAAVNTGRNLWAVHYADSLVRTSTIEFTSCLNAFEAMVAAGFSKDSVLTGDYHPASLMKAGLAAARSLDANVAPYRRQQPDLLQLVAYCSRSVSAFASADVPTTATTEPAKQLPFGQLEMF